MTDPIADMLTRIRNAYLTNKTKVQVPHSKIKLSLAERLIELGYLTSLESQPPRSIILTLSYINKQPSVTKIKRISKPGRRAYLRATKLPKTLSGYGESIVSTSLGLMTAAQAKKKNVGGEIICQIW